MARIRIKCKICKVIHTIFANLQCPPLPFSLVLFDVFIALNLGEVVEDVEGADVELVDGEYRGVAADDERKISESSDAVGDANGKLLAKVFGTPLRGRSKLI